MRQLCDVPEEQLAQRLCDALDDHGIQSQIKKGDDGGLTVWVVDESHMGRASGLVDEWLGQSAQGSEAFDAAARRGRSERELKSRIERRSSRPHAKVLATRKPPALTWGLIAVSLGVALLTRLGTLDSETSMLLMGPLMQAKGASLSLFGGAITLLPLPWAEPWRFVTPLFLHFNYAQIVFDALLFRELGRVVEGHRGARFFALFVTLSAIVSGVAQYELAHSSLFGSMCGVIYALAGWLLVRRRFDINSTHGVTPGTFPVLLIWLALGLFNLFHIAKWCQLVGLAFGMLWSRVEFRFKYAKKPL